MADPPKFPQFGDPELLPKGRVTRPSRRRMPFDASGRLIPEGPEFTEPPGVQPDIKGLPWSRVGFDSWTSEAQRTIVKDFIRKLMADNFPTYNGWEVIEKNSNLRTSALRSKNPFLIIKLRQISDGAFVEVAIDFVKTDRDDATQFAAQVALAGPALLAQSP